MASTTQCIEPRHKTCQGKCQKSTDNIIVKKSIFRTNKQISSQCLSKYGNNTISFSFILKYPMQVMPAAIQTKMSRKKKRRQSNHSCIICGEDVSSSLVKNAFNMGL